jgi:DNA-binding HxlR family transcriptional regulator
MAVISEVGAPLVPQPVPTEARRPPRGDRELIENVELALEVLHGKRKVHLLFLMARGIRRHSRLLECLPGASKKVMTETLRALERDGLVTRRIYAEVPVRVEYSLTPLGWTMSEPLVALAEWGGGHADEVSAARLRCRLGESNGNGNGKIARLDAPRERTTTS